MPSFYFPDIRKDSTEYCLSGDEFHHLVQVMRKKEGDLVNLTNGKGILAEVEITRIYRNNLSFKLRDSIEKFKSNPKMALAFSLLKSRHDNLIVEKCTELGCSSFYPMETQRTVRHSSKNTRDKFLKTAISAIKQCDSAFLPDIHDILPLQDTIEQIKKDGFTPLVALENCKSSSIYEVWREGKEIPFAVITGPEGGFTTDEIDYFKKAEIKTISLGNHILRAETAAIAAVSIFSGLNFSSNKRYY